jgi:hypothetical protein
MAHVRAVDLTKLIVAAQHRIDMVVRKITLDLYGRVIMRTPVDTGRARGGWTCSVDQPDLSDTGTLDPTGSTTMGVMASRVSTEQVLGVKIYLTNNVEYIRFLEYGAEIGAHGSPQAPQGMVRLTVKEFADALDKANQAIP